jgi:hypothetical protein
MAEKRVSRQVGDTQEDDTYAWRVRKVVSLPSGEEGEMRKLVSNWRAD